MLRGFEAGLGVQAPRFSHSQRRLLLQAYFRLVAGHEFVERNSVSGKLSLRETDDWCGEEGESGWIMRLQSC